jgi:protein MpaA
VATTAKTDERANALRSFIFGKTATGLPIPAYRFGEGPESKAARVLIIGGVHGSEIEGVWAALGLLKSFSESFPYHLRLTLIPMLNVDGVLTRERKNGHKVDLNRNMPTRDWTNDVKEEKYYPGPHANSEPESVALVNFLEREPQDFILSLHSWNPMLNVNGDCSPEAEEIQKHTGYRIEKSIGYPTPGCLGTYAGLERAMPTITYEIERGLSQDQVLSIHVPAILNALKLSEKRGQK